MEQYIRSYELTIGQPNSIGFVLDDHEIDFSVKKGQENDKSINKLTLKIIGLDKEYRDALTAKNNMAIIFSAGYQNKTVIFQGKITKASSKKNATDYETNIEAAEGYIALREAKTSKSFPAGTNALTIINALCSDLMEKENDLALGTIYNSELLSNKIYRNGYSICGFTKAEISKILQPLNMNFSIQNNIIYIAARDKITQQQGFLLDYSSGLIIAEKTKNDPQATEKEKKPVDGVNFEAFLNGALQPLSMIKINNDDSVNSNYKIISIEHKGTYLGGDWISKGFAVEVR
ncbi:baseplate hub protein [Silvanigrella sp.]|jgi:hypothetical protein|uniref:baseplate hub protein n=1 Tax=Silvanigrella sp. TaxID=2024976 RepID=UPI0037CB1C12